MFKKIRKIVNKRSKKDFTAKLQKFIKKHQPKQIGTVLVWEMGGFNLILAKNAMFAAALKLRGYKPHFIICDGAPDACIQRGLEKNEEIKDWKNSCDTCLKNMLVMAKKYDVEYSLTSEFIDEKIKSELAEIAESTPFEDIVNFKYLGIGVGEIAFSSFGRYMKGYVVDIKEIKEEYKPVFRKYLYASLVNTYISNVVIEKMKPNAILASHGVYVDYAPPVMLGYAKKIPSVGWSSGFFDYSHYFTSPENELRFQLRAMRDVEWEKLKANTLSQESYDRLDEYLRRRYFQSMSRDLRNLSQPDSVNVLKQRLKIDNNNKTVALFAHINWDACFDMSAMVFDSPNQWVVESIKQMIEIKNVNWIIKVHPGELTDGSLYTTYDIIEDYFGVNNLPEHIKIISYNTEINSYGLYNLIDAGITIFGTVGVELSCLGKPVITAGEGHFYNKGFTIDPKNKEEYFAVLKNMENINPLTNEQIELARKYAYSYFIQRQIPLNAMNKKQGHWGDLDTENLHLLLPGRDSAMDRLCEAIIKGHDVILNEKDLKNLNA